MAQVEVLLSKGADINAIDRESGWNVLHYAAESRDPAMFYFLVQCTNVASTILTRLRVRVKS